MNERCLHFVRCLLLCSDSTYFLFRGPPYINLSVVFLGLSSNSIGNHLLVKTAEGFFIINQHRKVVKQLWLVHFWYRFWIYEQVWFPTFIHHKKWFKLIDSCSRTIEKHQIHHRNMIVNGPFSLFSSLTHFHSLWTSLSSFLLLFLVG